MFIIFNFSQLFERDDFSLLACIWVRLLLLKLELTSFINGGLDWTFGYVYGLSK